MTGYKHIENSIGQYIVRHYRCPVEIGVGNNFTVVELLGGNGIHCRCTDIKHVNHPENIDFFRDDILSPDISLYHGADLLYSIRPGVEMIPPLKNLAATIDCDLLVYHLGFESWGDGGEKIDCGVTLHRYYRFSAR